MSDSLQPHDYTVHGILQARLLEWVPFPSPGDLPYTGIESKFPALQADSLPVEPQGKPKNTGMGSLSSSTNLPDPEIDLPDPGIDLPDPGIKPGSPALQADSLPIELSRKPTNHLK